MDEVERRICESDDCEGTEVGNTRKCGGCLQKLTDQGWKIRKNGAMYNPTTGVRIAPGGSVTVSANYNPRMMALMAGEINVEDLDEDELARGMCRNLNGEFPKKIPNMVPKAMYDRMTRELFERSDQKLREGLVDAVESLVEMIGDKEVDASTRLKATTWMFERLRGKVPDVVQITQEKPFEQVLTHIHRGPRTRVEEVVEGELVRGTINPRQTEE